MSYNVAICLPPISPDDNVAWAELDAVIDEKGEVPAVFKQLHDELTARFPCICTLPDDKVDDGLWADGPLWNNFGHRAAVLAMSHSKAHEAMPFIIERANKLGLVVFDWAGPAIHRPPSTSLPPQSPSGARRETKWVELRERIEWKVRDAIVIIIWLGCIAMGVWGVIYFFWHT